MQRIYNVTLDVIDITVPQLRLMNLIDLISFVHISRLCPSYKH